MTTLTRNTLGFLRFLNLLEPKRNILSISKIWMWLMIGLTVFVLINDPSDFAAVVSAITAQLVATGNYGYRRWVQSKGGDNAPAS